MESINEKVFINIDGEQYELRFTTKAMKEIAGKYGGIEEIQTALLDKEDKMKALDDVIWLITTLANQPILIHNLKNPHEKKQLLTTEYVEVMTSICDFMAFRDAISLAISAGSKRNIESESDEKNIQGA